MEKKLDTFLLLDALLFQEKYNGPHFHLRLSTKMRKTIHTRKEQPQALKINCLKQYGTKSS